MFTFTSLCLLKLHLAMPLTLSSSVTYVCIRSSRFPSSCLRQLYFFLRNLLLLKLHLAMPLTLSSSVTYVCIRSSRFPSSCLRQLYFFLRNLLLLKLHLAMPLTLSSSVTYVCIRSSRFVIGSGQCIVLYRVNYNCKIIHLNSRGINYILR
jgi:hypothetical protein